MQHGEAREVSGVVDSAGDDPLAGAGHDLPAPRRAADLIARAEEIAFGFARLVLSPPCSTPETHGAASAGP